MLAARGGLDDAAGRMGDASGQLYHSSVSHIDPTDIRGQEAAQSEREKQQAAAALHEAEDFKWLMSNKRGRRIVWRLLDRAGVHRTSFHTNALTMAFNEGARNEGLRLTAQCLKYCPGSYNLMISEKDE